MPTKVNYNFKVINSPYGLKGYSEPSTASKEVSTFVNGSMLSAKSMAAHDGEVWFQEPNTSAWVMSMSKKAATSLKPVKVKNANKLPNLSRSFYMGTPLLHENIGSLVRTDTTAKKPPTPKGKSTAEKISKPASTTKLNKGTNFILPNKQATEDVLCQNDKNYPPKSSVDRSGNILYDWTINMEQFSNMLTSIKKNLNVPSAYTRDDLARLTNTKFNRYKIEFGDYKLKPTMAYAVFTRPDLNLFDDDRKILPQISNDPQLYYIWKNNPSILKQLSLSYAGDNKLIPLLTNQITAIDVADETLETGETGETWSGFKTQYAKNSIRSMTAGSISLKFPETSNLSVTHMMQCWCSYENGVYRGTLMPKDEYCYYKILDYACNIYYFLMDRDWTIRFWTTYYGAFPTNVNKSIFSFDMGSDSGGADVNVTFNYFHKLDLDIRSLVDFNNLGGGITDSTSYKLDVSPDICMGGGGSTWSGAPFVQVVSRGDGVDTIDELKFRFRAE